MNKHDEDQKGKFDSRLVFPLVMPHATGKAVALLKLRSTTYGGVSLENHGCAQSV